MTHDNMIHIDCPLCGVSAYDVLQEASLAEDDHAFDFMTESPTHYRIVACSSCGFQYSNPIFTPEDIDAEYSNCAIDEAFLEKERVSLTANSQRYMERLLRHGGRGNGRYLDVGCGCGHMLERAQAHGLQPHGVEPSQEQSAFAARLAPGATLHNGLYEEGVFPEDHFHLASVIHVIDHVTDPLGLLRNVRRNLAPGGHVIVATHNIDSLLAKIQKQDFIAWSIQHISYFTPATLRSMIEAAGLEHVHTQGSLTTYTLGHLAENGLPAGGLRRLALGTLRSLRMTDLRLNFPFGNFEIIARKPQAAGAS